MHELHTLKEKLCAELEKYSSKEMTASSLDYIDKLAHAIKNIDKIIDGGEYSGAYPAHYSMRRDYPRRDAMGRYSSASSMIEELKEMRRNAPNDRAKIELDRFIERMETM